MLKTTVKGAILAAADTIEQHPERYVYMGSCVPWSNGSACLWGFIGLHLGLEPGTINNQVAQKIVPPWSGTEHLYEFMERTSGFGSNWRNDATVAARGLRQYAELFEPSTMGEV